MKDTEQSAELLTVYERAGIKTPHTFQGTAWEHIVNGANTLISASTGSGKTEAAVLPALKTGKRLILLYPTKALLQDQLGRVERLASSQSIAVDTGDEDDLSYYHADVILTSLDKFLYRMFGYGRKRFGYLFPYRIAGGDADRRTLLLFDEAHAYDGTSFSHFWFLLKKLTYERRVQTILLSATLPPQFLQMLRDSDRRYFPRSATEGDFFQVADDKGMRSGRLLFGGMVRSGKDAIDQAWDAYQQGKRVIMVLRRVVSSDDDRKEGGCALQEVWLALLERASRSGLQHEIANPTRNNVTGSILAYHGHQWPSYRRLVLNRLTELDNSKQAYLLLTTSAMEVGVDISCDVMITDLCEPDSFVQRIGRCARRKAELGRVYIAQSELAPQGTAALRDYFLRLSAGATLDSRCMSELNAMNMTPDLDNVHLRLEYVQDVALYRYVYDFVQENRAVWKQGVLITREWEPCVPLVRSEQRSGDTFIAGIPEREFWRGKELKEKILLPVTCAADISPFCAWIFETINSEFHHPQRVPVGGKQQRSLKEALSEAHYSAGANEKKSKPQYAVGFPLILLLGSAVAADVFKDDNLGLTYQRRFAKTTVHPPSPLLRVRQIELHKEKGQVVLPLYWYEPVEDGQ